MRAVAGAPSVVWRAQLLHESLRALLIQAAHSLSAAALLAADAAAAQRDVYAAFAAEDAKLGASSAITDVIFSEVPLPVASQSSLEEDDDDDEGLGDEGSPSPRSAATASVLSGRAGATLLSRLLLSAPPDSAAALAAHALTAEADAADGGADTPSLVLSLACCLMLGLEPPPIAAGSAPARWLQCAADAAGGAAAASPKSRMAFPTTFLLDAPAAKARRRGAGGEDRFGALPIRCVAVRAAHGAARRRRRRRGVRGRVRAALEWCGGRRPRAPPR